MRVKEAKKLLEKIVNKNGEFSKEDEFQIQELSKLILEKEKSGNYASFIGEECVKNEKLDLALYYLELSIEYGYLHSYKYAGDIYHNGEASCGKDLKKAFEYYTKASQTEKIGDGSWENPYSDVHNDAKIALAKMYKNGEYVEKDYEEYKRIINEVYDEVMDDYDEQAKYTILEEKALIALEENDKGVAAEYLFDAMNSSAAFYFQTYLIDELYKLDEIVNKLYELTPIDLYDFSFPEIFYLLKKPFKMKFALNDKEYHIESVVENGLLAVRLEDQWFRDAEEMIDKAKINRKSLKSNIMNIDYWVIEA